MGKPEPQRARPRGPQRLESGTRVVAVRLPTPQTPAPAMRDQMPTRELDVAELRKMALRCASDADAEPLADASPDLPAPPRARLELLLEAEEAARTAVTAEDDVEIVFRPRRAARAVMAFVLVVAVVAVAIWLYATWAGLV